MQSIITLRERFQPGAWFKDANAQRLCTDHTLNLTTMYHAAGVIALLEGLGALPQRPTQLTVIGCAKGEGLVALDAWAGQTASPDNRLQLVGFAADPDEYKTAAGVAADLGAHVSVEHTDDESALHELSGQDVIFAHMFGPVEADATRASQDIPAALGALANDGVVVVTSHLIDMGHVGRWAHATIPDSYHPVTPSFLPASMGKTGIALFKN